MVLAEAILEASGSIWRFFEPLHPRMVFQSSGPLALLMGQVDAALVEPLLLVLAAEKIPPLARMVGYQLVE